MGKQSYIQWLWIYGLVEYRYIGYGISDTDIWIWYIPPYIGYIGYMVDGPWQGFDGIGVMWKH